MYGWVILYLFKQVNSDHSGLEATDNSWLCEVKNIWGFLSL